MTNIVNKVRNAAAASAVAFLFAPAALAQGTGGPDLGLGFATAIGLTTTDIRTTIARIISYFLGFLGILVVGIMLYAGFLWMTAGGNEEKVSTAKKWMLNGTIGLAIIMSAFAITQFIFRAVEEGTGNIVGGGCPPDQICSGGIGPGGGGGGFRVDATTPAGAGPGNGGWPKNYAITVNFNATVSEPSVTPSSVEVSKCNARLDGSGDPDAFNLSSCGAAVAGTLSVDGNKVRFRPSATPGPEPTDYEGDFWYKIRLQGGSVRDMAGRVLLCPFQTVDISSPGAGSDYCERAVAFNNLRDVEPPTVSVNAPATPPALCASPTLRIAQVLAVANDDFLVNGIDYLLDGGSENLVDQNNDPLSSSSNGSLVNPFTGDNVYVDIGPLASGSHTISAIAQDGVPQSSSQSSRGFTVNPPHCCNGTQDDLEGETGLDCGGACGSCNGSSCTDNSQCASGFCNPATNQCEPRPAIQSVSPMGGGVGTLVTITGTSFGTSPGGIAFVGADTDGDGNPEGDADDVAAIACAPQAWSATQVTVAVPEGAVSGPIKLITSAGPSDRTDDDFGPVIGSFSVGGPTPPGICYLAPSEGGPGTKVSVNGTGFGATQAASTAFIGSNGLDVVTCGAGETDCGWGDTRVWVTIPPIAENVYPVRLVINGTSTNNRNFLIRSSSAGQPRVTAVIPESGPVGSYVTIQGSNFGTIKGTVRFKFGADTAIAEDPICDNNWHDNYIIVKVPPEYEGDLPLNVSPSGVSHQVQVVTAPPANTSNDDITFKVTNEAPKPGVCAITPDNGPPGNAVMVEGEGFGAGPATTNFALPPAAPRFSVDFFKSQAKRCLFSPGTSCSVIGSLCTNPAHGICVLNSVPSIGYSSWTGIQIGTIVAGETLKRCSINTAALCIDVGLPCPDPTDGTCVADRSGWPATGPVYVISNNQLSSNAIPFTIQDCTESGASCPNGQTCCANGSCQASCQPVARASAYGWRFSTNVLPTLPVVVERAICNATSLPPTMQSPSPFKGATDACKNAQLFFEFSRELDTTTFNSTTVKVDECGDASQPNCTVDVPLNPFSTPGSFSTCDSMNPTHCKTFQTRPANSYNGGTHYFKKNFWYRVTLVSSPTGVVGLREPGVEGRYLDGDLDRRQGGDYVYSFRVRNSDDPCELSNVIVIPPVATIEQDQDPVNFNSGLLGGNCNLLQCGPSEPYAIAWASNASYLDRLPTLEAGCVQPIIGVSETPPGAPTTLTADVTPTPLGTGPSKSGDSAVTVKFADPRVVEVTPKAGCTQACINSAIVATFNVPMDSTTLTGSTVEIKRCRNASCTAPFETTLGGTMVGVSIAAAPTDGVAPDGFTILHKHVSVQYTGNMAPGTFYLVRIRGGSAGVKSRSGVHLTGLNDGQFYAWKFRTKDDPTACSVARTSVEPPQVETRYVGERKDFRVTPFGSPDECSPAGQELNSTAYNWLWSLDAPNPVVQGFLDGIAPFTPLTTLASPAQVVDTMPIAKTGCTSRCLLSGSQTAVPQCGNGLAETQFEECDDGNAIDTDACTNQCVRRGNTAPTCGDGTADAAVGESCDKVSGNGCAGGANDGMACTTDAECTGGTCTAPTAFPNGCKRPGVHVDGFADNIGCIFTGSSTGVASTCGDGFVSDGEACDDGNSENGDGCSANCVKEGSLRTCLGAPASQPCMNFCGNGVDEPGEDPSCDPNPGLNGCNPQTCLKNGKPRCVGGATVNCCGNGVADAGEEALCETDPERAEFCTDSCLLKGSSAFYTSPSFCGDGIAGKGEKTSCEPSDFVEPPPTPKIDRYQAIAVRPQITFDSETSSGSTSSVKATVADVADADAGRGQVHLSCNCKNEPPGAQDSYCQGINPPTTNDLACADNGCCTPRPTVELVEPTPFNSCRNALVTITFSELMNPSTIAQNLLVGYNNGTAPCPAGSTEVTPLAFGDGERPSFWSRLWNGIASFFRNYVLRPVFGSPPSPPTAGEQSERYCSVEGIIATVTMGPPDDQKSVTTFSVRRALPANKYIRIRLNPGVKSAGGVPIDGGGYTAYFGTSTAICTIQKVEVTPRSLLLSSIQDRQTVIANGVSASGQAIVPTLDYNWEWSWTPAPAMPAANAWEIVIEPRQTNVTQCTLGSTCVAGGGCSCTIALQTCTVPNGESTCAISTTLSTAIADIRVRGGDPNDSPTGFVPKNTQGARPIEAVANVIGVSGTITPISSVVTDSSGNAVVLLCKRPWPQYQQCVAGFVDLPWDDGPNLACLTKTWYPFYDTTTNVEFYYCRDDAAAPAPAPAAAAPSAPLASAADDLGPRMRHTQLLAGEYYLPCLREEPALVLTPGPGILREYLLTFETNPANCPDMPPPGKWTDDAIGLRVAENLGHASVGDWYRARGFRGVPTPLVVDGYDAIKDGRTIYVNAAAKVAAGNIYSNVNVLSYSDGAEPETAQIFSGIASFIDFNRNTDLLNMGICRVGALRNDTYVRCNVDVDCRVNAAGSVVPGRDAFTCDVPTGTCKNGTTTVAFAGTAIGCDADLDCQVDGSGNFVPARAGVFKCDVPKSKLVRDVRRWSDLQALRSQLVQKKDATGRYPTLDAGTFLRAQSNSAWPSWTSALSQPLGVTLPADPLNRHGACVEAGFDDATCWNDRDGRYKCPRDSHVYEYRSVGGVDFQLRNDFEYKSVNGGTDVWAGSTCVERTVGTCNPSNDPNNICKLTCSSASTNAGSSCVVNSDCPGGACNGPCNYREGKIFVGGGSSPFPAAWCQGALIGSGGVCGDGILGPDEDCEVGQVSAQACDSNPAAAVRAGSRPLVCSNTCIWVPTGSCSTTSTNSGAPCAVNSDCLGPSSARCVNWAGLGAGLQDFRCVGGSTPDAACTGSCPGGGLCVGACIGGVCGDGIRQNPPEACDDGPLNGTYGHCNSNCTGTGTTCGDGKKQPNESCDCKEKNGQYDFDGILSTGNEPGVSGTACYTGSTNVHTCSWDCQAAGPRCGDSIVNGSETCDGGFQEFKGYCNDTAKTGCDTSAQCPAGSCVSDVCSHNASISCTADSDCVGICGNFCATPEQKRRRECRTNNPASNSDDSGGSKACEWASWVCTAPGDCGNGAKETGEECDDGNSDQTDACIIDPAQSYMCKTAKCGDGYVHPPTGEECDDGINNGRPCVPEYGLTCNYCSGACRVNTVSGGYCGDNLVQDAAWLPPGPEQCDGTTGLGESWICVSQKPEHQSYGKISGYSICKLNNCQRSCVDPDSNPCQNTGANTDSDLCSHLSGSQASYCTTLKTVSLSILPGGNMKCSTGFGGKKNCLELAALDLGSFIGSGSLYSLIGSLGTGVYVGGSYGSGYGVFAGSGSFNLKDSCDPDKDNDGVPNAMDCAPENKNIYPGYTIPRPADKGGPINIGAAEELCSDTIDNDCNGLRDNHLQITGKVVDIQTGGGMVGAMMQVLCGDAVVHEEAVASNGNINIDEWINNELCASATKWKLRVTHADPLCGETEKEFNYSHPSCMIKSNQHFEITKKPPAGTVRATVQWEADKDLDFHMYSSNGHHIYYSNMSIDDGGSIYTLDVDDQGSSTGLKNPGGIETITVARKPGVSYYFWVYNYNRSGNWKDFGPFQDKNGNPHEGPKLRIYYDDCSTYNPEDYGNDWPDFLNRGDLFWLAYSRSTDVAGAEPYAKGCISGTEAGPCAALCTDNSGGNACEAPKSDNVNP